MLPNYLYWRTLFGLAKFLIDIRDVPASFNLSILFDLLFIEVFDVT